MGEAMSWNEAMFSETFGEDEEFLMTEMDGLIYEEKYGLRILRSAKHAS